MGTLLQDHTRAVRQAAAPAPTAKKAPSPGAALTAFESRCITALRAALPKELKKRGTAVSAVGVEAMAQSLARQLAKLAGVPGDHKANQTPVPSGVDWVSTQEAAKLCGFSRPFVVALLDSGTYPGKVHRTAGGHRKVLASEFVALVAQASTRAPKTLAPARRAVDLKVLDASTRQAVQRFQQRITASFPAKEVIVFGSRARGDHRPDSDADVAVLLEGPRQPFLATKLSMSDAAYDVLLDTGINISPLPVWMDEWEHPQSYANPALLANIAREGIRV